jgi:hypothetical protein
MKFENYVCYKDKNDKIKSLGVEINSLLLNDSRTMNNSTNMVGGGKNKGKLFRANLGVPLPLLLIQEEAEKLHTMINTESNNNSPKKQLKKKSKNKKTHQPVTCVSNNLFDHLLKLQVNSTKKKKNTRKVKKKSKRKTRKAKSFF